MSYNGPSKWNQETKSDLRIELMKGLLRNISKCSTNDFFNKSVTIFQDRNNAFCKKIFRND